MKCVHDYELRYGDFLKEFKVEKYHDRLKAAGKKMPKISEFMEQNGEKVDEILQRNIKMTDTELNELIDEMAEREQHY